MESNRNQFEQIIIKNSNSKTYWEAVKEWTPSGVGYCSNNCICGHYIMENCFIRNYLNGNELVVGNVCINQFMSNIATETNHMVNVLRLSEEKRNNLTEEDIRYFHSKGTINEWEYSFISDTLRKRKLTPAQRSTKDRIYNKIKSSIIKTKPISSNITDITSKNNIDYNNEV